MTPAQVKAIAVAVDGLREAFGEVDLVRWLEQPTAVRELLKHTAAETAVDDDTGNSLCPSCGARLFNDDGELAAHDRGCAITESWLAIGDPRGTDDIERAMVEAAQIDARRADLAEFEAEQDEIMPLLRSFERTPTGDTLTLTCRCGVEFEYAYNVASLRDWAVAHLPHLD